MSLQIPVKRMILLLLSGLLGCLLMAGSDWLMIYGDPTSTGSLAWLTEGAAQIPAWRNALALFLAFPAVVFYSIALFGIRWLLKEDRKTYSFLTAMGMTPWLCLHLFYVMILFLFSWFTANGLKDLGFSAGEALFRQFSWIIPLGEVLMVLPFVWLFILILRGRSVFPRWMAAVNPLPLFAILKGITLLMKDSPARLAFTNGLMSESMAIWFVLLIPAVLFCRKK